MEIYVCRMQLSDTRAYLLLSVPCTVLQLVPLRFPHPVTRPSLFRLSNDLRIPRMEHHLQELMHEVRCS